MKARIFVFAACLAAAVFPPAARCLDAAGILSRVDEVLNAPRDRRMEARLL